MSPPLLPFSTDFPVVPFPAASFKILDCAGSGHLLASSAWAAKSAFWAAKNVTYSL